MKRNFRKNLLQRESFFTRDAESRMRNMETPGGPGVSRKKSVINYRFFISLVSLVIASFASPKYIRALG